MRYGCFLWLDDDRSAATSVCFDVCVCDLARDLMKLMVRSCLCTFCGYFLRVPAAMDVGSPGSWRSLLGNCPALFARTEWNGRRLLLVAAGSCNACSAYTVLCSDLISSAAMAAA